jgi:NADH:ubiquinone oxidoreductase subunit H
MVMTTALMTSAVIPWGGGGFHLSEGYHMVTATDIDVALLYLLEYVNRCVRNYDCGWASNNKFINWCCSCRSQMISK